MNSKSARFPLVVTLLVFTGMSMLPETALAAEEGNPWGIWLNL
jgi:hypothetical protein